MRLPWWPFGTAPLVLAAAAALSGILILALRPTPDGEADLVFAVFSRQHQATYERILPVFEAREGVRVRITLNDARALQSRLQAALAAGAAVPDVVELCEPSIGYFTSGPLEDCGLVDLTDRIRAEGVDRAMVPSRFGMWSSRGRIFALPHDLHPVCLAYREDRVREAGIDPATLTSWAAFAEAGRKAVADRDGDGAIDRWMVDLPIEGDFGLQTLLLQAGGNFFAADGTLTMDDPVVARTVCWYIRATRGRSRIAFPAGWGQPLAKAFNDGLVLFMIAPDWRTRQMMTDMGAAAGQARVMPLPAWTAGGRRTSTWGGTGLAITKACRKQELAWKLARFLYLETEGMGQRFLESNILPPVRAAWDLPELQQPYPFFGGQRIGRIYADLAGEVPDYTPGPWIDLAKAKAGTVVDEAGAAYERDPAIDLEALVTRLLSERSAEIRTVMARNRFLTQAAP